jgi:hypothetical protein
MERMGFKINYENPHNPVPAPETYEGYDLESAFYDYAPSGARATIAINGYELEMTELKLVSLVRASLPLAESLSTLPSDDWPQLRKCLPHLPQEVKIYHLIFPDFILWLPVIVFASDGETIRIYTRTWAEGTEGKLIVWEERDRAEPVEVPHRAVINEIRSFLVRYLDDLTTAYPFIRADEKYEEYQERIAALRE